MLNTISNIELSFTKKDENNWILEHSDKFFIVSNELKSLLDLLNRNHYNLNHSYKEFIDEFEYVSQEDFNSILEESLKDLELDKIDDASKKNKSFILFERKLISKEKAAIISKVIQPLFQPTFFWITFSLLFIFSLYNLAQMHHFHLEKEYIFFLFLLYILSAFVHEFGHIAACNRFTKRNGEIGVGIYFIFPVFYSNITPIWTAKKEERIITNLAGVYIQLFVITALYISYLITDNHQLYDVIGIGTVIILYQLIPFIRTDGYWIVSDLTNTPNLLPISSKMVNTFIKNPFKFNIKDKKDWLIFLYGIFNQLVIIYLIVSIMKTYTYRLITGPIEFIKIIFKQPKEIINYLNTNLELMIISIVFYMIVFNLIKRIFKN